MPFLITLTFWAICIAWFVGKFAFSQRSRRKPEEGFDFVYVEDDGSARALDVEERAYLQTEFKGGDGGRPYIKSNYEAVTPDNRLSGFLLRRQLPQEIRVKPAAS